jgi:hypothetical protein
MRPGEVVPLGILMANRKMKFTVEFCLCSARPKLATGTHGALSFLSFFLLSLLTPPLWAQVKHWNSGQRDRVAECVGRILERKALIDVGSSVDASICEGETAEGVVKRLGEKSLKLISNDQWVLVSDNLPSTGKIIVVTRLTAPELTRVQQDLLETILIEQSRFIPVEYALDREADGSQTVDILLDYDVTVMPGNAPGVLRMAVLLHQSDVNRIIFVETQNGAFDVKWDSGELDAAKVDVDFDDVDGDGNEEIVVTGERSLDYDSPKDHVLAVFDAEGRELTRQEKCTNYEYAATRSEAELVCPIEGVDVSFITETVPWEIEASRGGTSGKMKSTIFRLMKEKGRYVAVASPTAKSALKNAKP